MSADVDELIDGFFADDLDDESISYLLAHRRRYSFLLRLVEQLALGAGPACAILDVGPSWQTELLRDRLPSSRISTLGFAPPRAVSHESGSHVELDLNELANRDRWPMLAPQDVVVVAEVIEHLHVAPTHVLRFLAQCLVPGGRLVLQTPNACALLKRLQMATGRNPFELIREDATNAGHFREYTAAEVTTLGAAAGLELVQMQAANYFDFAPRRHRVFVALEPIVPASLRDGLTATFRKPV